MTIAHECGKEICTLGEAEIKAQYASKINAPSHLALWNAGVDSTTHISLSTAHTEEDIDHTVEAYEKAFTALQTEQLL